MSEPMAAATDLPLANAPANAPLSKQFLGFAIDAVSAAFLLMLFSFVFAVPVIAGYTVFLTPPGGSTPDPAVVMQAAMPAIVAGSMVAMAMTAFLLWLLRGRPLRDPQAPMAAGPAYALAVVVGLAIQALGHGLSWLSEALAIPVEPSNIEPVMAVVREWPVLAWFAVVLLAPLSEELLFRHVLLRRFAVAGRGLIGIAATALLFGLLHEFAPGESGMASWLMTLAVYIVMGVGFGAVYVRTRRFGAAFAAHAACNLAAMLLLTFSPP
jgi:membrane protease YdiL (CAAX protease family)